MNKTQTWWGGETLKIFQPPKVHAAQDEAKNGRSGSILAWRMDDGWWGGHQRNKTKLKNKKKNHDNKIKPTPVQPRPRPPKIKNLKQPSSWAQIDTEERCSHVHHRRKTNQTKCNGKKEHHVMQLFIRLEAGGKEWGYEFLCQHGEMYGMYECVWLHMLPLYEGRVPCSSWVRNFSLHAFCSNFFLRLLGVLRWKRSAPMKMKIASVLFQ